jgi:anthranilate phosphoribosyltransferase
MTDQASDSQIAGLLVALRAKGETVDELVGFARTMREKSVKVRADDPHAIDMCGTGGDGLGTFNISTLASLVAAGAGVTVAKHGNRSVSSRSGSADLLKALGVNISIPPERAGTCLNVVGVGFLFAPLFHPAMKYAARPRADDIQSPRPDHEPGRGHETTRRDVPEGCRHPDRRGAHPAFHRTGLRGAQRRRHG